MKKKISVAAIVVLSIFVVLPFLIFKKDLSGNAKISFRKMEKVLSLPGGPIHFLRIQRERFANLFVFGDYDSSSRHIVLANKRMFEAEGLLEYGRFNNSVKFFLKAREEAELGFVFMKKAEEKREDTNYLKEEVKKNLLRQQKYLENIKDRNLNLQEDSINNFLVKIKDRLNEVSF